MKCITKLSLVLLSCLSFTKGAVSNENANVDLSAFFANLIEKNQTPAPTTQVAGVTANPTEINDDVYTQEDLKKYTKFLINLVSNDQQPQQPQQPVTTTTTTTTTALATSTNILGDIKDLSAELDQIKERRVDEIGELIDIVKNVSLRLETLEETVEQTLAKQNTEVANTVPDTTDVDLNNAEVDSAGQPISPINESDLKYAAIYHALNKDNEQKMAENQETEIKLLEEIKELLMNNNNNNNAQSPAPASVDNTKAAVVVNNVNEEVNAAPPPETSEEAIIKNLNNEADEFEKLYQDINKNIDEYKKMVSDKNENVTSDEQFTKAAVIRDKTKTIKQYINKLASMAKTDDQKKKLKEINDKYDNTEDKHIENVANNNGVAQDEAAAKETAKENAEEAKKNEETPKNVVSLDHVKKIIYNIASNTVNEQQVDEVKRIIKEIELKDQAEMQKAAEDAEKVDQSVDEALSVVASNTQNEQQVESVRQFIKAIEAKAILDENLEKDEELRELISDVASNTTTEEQTEQVRRIIEKILLYNKFAEDTQQEREDNVKFGNEMASEIVKSPEEITNDLKNLLVNLVNNAKTEEDAANVANIIEQIKKHDKLIKEAKEQEEAANYTKVPNVKSVIINNDDGTSNEVFLIDDSPELLKGPEVVNPVNTEEVPNLELNDEESGNGKGIYVLGALGVIPLAGFGYSYRSKAKKLNDEFPFYDNNLPFSNSMNGLVVDKNFLFRKNSISKPDNIINNDAVIRPSQPSWATSILMDENNKKGLKDNIQITEDPEVLLDEQLREIQNKEKVIVKPNSSIVITIDDDSVDAKDISEAPKPKPNKTVKKPKLRRSVSSLTLDKKVKEDRVKKDKKGEASVEKKSRKSKSKKHQKKSRKNKEKKVGEETLDEETELSFNTSFILDAPSLLFDEEIELEKAKKKNLLNVEKPKVPKRISSCVNENLPSEKTDCPFTDDFAKELMEDYNKKFGEMKN